MSTTIRWVLLGFIALAAVLYATTDLNYLGYVISWGGAAWKCMSGAALGFFISRWVDKLDLSELPDKLRPMAGLSRAVIVGAGMIGVPLGS